MSPGPFVNKLRVLAVRPGQKPDVEWVDNTLQGFQEFVGGFINFYPVGQQTSGDHIEIVFYDHSVKLGLAFPYLSYNEMSPYFYTVTDRNGEQIDITDKQVSICLAHYRRAQKENAAGEALMTVTKVNLTADEILEALNKKA